MGVKGLQTYMEKECPSASEVVTTVDLRALADDYRREYPARREPLLIVDTMSLVNDFLYPPSLPWLYGGQWSQYLENIKHFISRFKEAGIALVFFFDGVVEKDNRRTWVQRRQEDMKRVKNIFRTVKKTGWEPESLYHIPPGLSSFTRMALKALGASVKVTSQHADREIAIYCRENDTLGVLAQDSDYVIYETGMYLSAQHLDLRTLRTKTYDRYALCAHLGLEISQLPLLACLMGNDVISSESLAGFHQKLTACHSRPSYRQLVPALAKFILKFGSPLRETLVEIEQTIFQHHPPGTLTSECAAYDLGQSQHAQSVLPQRQSREFKVRLSPELCRHLLNLHVNAACDNKVFGVLLTAEADAGTVLEDDLDQSRPSSNLLYRPMRQTSYGVLMGVRQGAGEEPLELGRNAVDEWFVYAGNPLNQPDRVRALPLPGGSPSLRTLWLGGKQHKRVRLECFLKIMEYDDIELFHKIPEQYQIFCLVLHYMHGGRCISDFELDAFVAQAVSPLIPSSLGKVTHSAQQLDRLQIKTISTQAIHLSSIFMRGVTTSLVANSTAGMPLPLKSLESLAIF